MSSFLTTLAPVGRTGVVLYRHVITRTNGGDGGYSEEDFGESSGEGKKERETVNGLSQ